MARAEEPPEELAIQRYIPVPYHALPKPNPMAPPLIDLENYKANSSSRFAAAVAKAQVEYRKRHYGEGYVPYVRRHVAV